MIIDDGWQTTSHGRGYGAAGDWTVAESKFPDPAGLVARLREHGPRSGTGLIGRARRLGLHRAGRAQATHVALRAGLPATVVVAVGERRTTVDLAPGDPTILEL